MNASLERRIVGLGLAGHRPAEIAAATGVGGDTVRPVLSRWRFRGLPIPLHSTAPIKPRMPASNRSAVVGDERDALGLRIARLIRRGKSQRETARELGVSLGFVQRTVARRRRLA